MAKNQWTFILEGDKSAFLDFYENNYQSFFSYGFRMTGDKELTKDCIQELFLELWKSRHSLNIEVKDARSYLITWLRRIISRRLKNIYAQSGSVRASGELLSEPSYEELLVLQQSDEETKIRLQRALAKLTPKQLIVIRSRFFENKSFEQIGLENSMALQTVYNTIYKSLISLKQNMREEGLVSFFLILSVYSNYFF